MLEKDFVLLNFNSVKIPYSPFATTWMDLEIIMLSEIN